MTMTILREDFANSFKKWESHWDISEIQSLLWELVSSHERVIDDGTGSPNWLFRWKGRLETKD